MLAGRLIGTRGFACALQAMLCLLAVGNIGCSLKTYAINMVGDALASGNSVYETDDDIDLVGQALPFGLKLTESLLEQSPNHHGLLITAVGDLCCIRTHTCSTNPKL
jgi:hypothetical protein